MERPWVASDPIAGDRVAKIPFADVALDAPRASRVACCRRARVRCTWPDQLRTTASCGRYAWRRPSSARSSTLPRPPGSHNLPPAASPWTRMRSCGSVFVDASPPSPPTLGFLIFARRRSEPIALLISFFFITWVTLGEGVSVLAAANPAFQVPAKILDLLSTVSLPLFFGLFPNGRMVPRLYWIVVAYFGIGYFLQSTLDLGSSSNPLGSFWTWTGWLSVMFGGVAAGNLPLPARVSSPAERQQTRWVLFGLGAIPAFLLTTFAYIGITGDATLGTQSDRDLLRRSAFLIVSAMAFQVVFLSIGVAILRSKLFDIDVIIRKTLVYSVVTALLALVYLGGVVLLQRLVAALDGRGAVSAGGGRLDAGHRGLVHAAASPHPEACRPAVLPGQVRRPTGARLIRGRRLATAPTSTLLPANLCGW